MVNQKYLDKAEVLIEALPYIQRFNRKIVVIKYGGSAMLDEKLKANVIKDAVLLKLVGFKPIIVHGGGKEISKWVGKVGMEAKFINGLRVTDSQTMEIAEMVHAKVNKELVSHVESLGVQAVGILILASLKCESYSILQFFFLLLIFQVILIKVIGVNHLSEFSHTYLAKALILCEKHIIHAVGYGIKIMGNHENCPIVFLYRLLQCQLGICVQMTGWLIQ